MNKKALSVIAATSMTWWGCSHAELLGCLIEPDRVADVGSQSTGVIEKLSVERGDAVASGQVVARLNAGVEKASVSVAEVKARAEAETLQAQAAYELARRKLERTRDLVKRDFVSDQALDQAEAEARVAQQRVEQAREAQRVAHREFMLSNAQLAQREVRSPFAGIVVERYRTEGERIEREPVIRVARLDPLRVEAIVPASQFGTVKPGQQANIKTDLPDFPVLSAQVTLVDRVVDPASNSFRVRLSVPNPGNRIPSGLRCRIAFGGAEAPASATQPGAATPAPAAAPAAATVQVAPTRWAPPTPPAPTAVPMPQGRVMTVSYNPTNKSAMLPLPGGEPKRFISSTLKFAMAVLANTSPGGRIPSPQALPLKAGIQKALADRPNVMALSTAMPSLADAPAASAESVAPAAPPAAVVAIAKPAVKPVATAKPAPAAVAADVRLASVR
ncbi:MAG: efflux RND transporter periplasmic adaptor subunit [Aquabacterium sp.]